MGVCALWLYYVFGTSDIIERSGGNPIGRDFFNFHNGGRVAFRSFIAGDVSWLYDREAYTAYAVAAGITNAYTFSYPPHTLVILSIIGWLPYKMALAIWSFGSAFAFVAALRPHLKHVGHDFMALCILCPAALLSFYWGQTGLWVGALLAGGLWLTPRHPYLAGVLFGILTFKPQLGATLAILLLVTWRWQVIKSALLTAGALIAMSFAMFGAEPWSKFLLDTTAFQMSLMSKNIGAFDYMVLTPFRSLVLLGMSTSVAMTIHIALAVTAIAAAGWLGLTCNWDRAAGFVLIASSIMSPYFATYDLTLIAAGMVWLWPYLSRLSKGFLLFCMLWQSSLVLMLFYVPAQITALGTLTILIAVYLVFRDLEIESHGSEILLRSSSQ